MSLYTFIADHLDMTIEEAEELLKGLSTVQCRHRTRMLKSYESMSGETVVQMIRDAGLHPKAPPSASQVYGDLYTTCVVVDESKTLELEKELGSLREQLAETKQQLSQARSSRLDLIDVGASTAGRLEQENRALTQSLQETRGEYEELMVSMEDLRGLATELSQEQARLQVQNARLREDAKEHEDELRKLRDQLTGLRDERDNLLYEHEGGQYMVARAAEQDAQIKNLQARVKCLEREKNTIRDSLEGEIGELRGELEDALAVCKVYNEDKRKLQDEIELHQADIDKLSRDLKDALDEVKLYQGKSKDLNLALVNHQEANRDLRDQLQASKEEAESKYKGLYDDFQEYTAKNAVLKDRVHTLESDLGEREAEVSSLREEMKALARAREDTDYDSEIQKYREHTTQLRAEVKILKQELRKARVCKKCSGAAAKCAEIEQKLAEAMDKCAEMERRFDMEKVPLLRETIRKKNELITRLIAKIKETQETVVEETVDEETVDEETVVEETVVEETVAAQTPRGGVREAIAGAVVVCRKLFARQQDATTEEIDDTEDATTEEIDDTEDVNSKQSYDPEGTDDTEDVNSNQSYDADGTSSVRSFDPEVPVQAPAVPPRQVRVPNSGECYHALDSTCNFDRRKAHVAYEGEAIGVGRRPCQNCLKESDD